MSKFLDIIHNKGKGMTVDQLYDYITQYMTPGAALKKLLSASLFNYQKLKFRGGEEIHPEYLIAMAAMDLGWDIAVEKPINPDDIVRGITVGESDYIDTIFKNKDDKEMAKYHLERRGKKKKKGSQKNKGKSKKEGSEGETTDPAGVD